MPYRWHHVYPHHARKNKDGSRIEYVQFVHKWTKASSLVKRGYKAFEFKLFRELEMFPAEEGKFGLL